MNHYITSFIFSAILQSHSITSLFESVVGTWASSPKWIAVFIHHRLISQQICGSFCGSTIDKFTARKSLFICARIHNFTFQDITRCKKHRGCSWILHYTIHVEWTTLIPYFLSNERLWFHICFIQWTTLIPYFFRICNSALCTIPQFHSFLGR